MGKKMNVKDLLESAIVDNMDTKEEVEGLKEQRSTKINNAEKSSIGIKERSDKNVEGSKARTTVQGKFTMTKLSRREQKKVVEFERLMEQDHYTDKKEQFIFRLSKACFDDYERLDSACSYKLEKKVSRNDIMRKALEFYHQENIRELNRIIDKI